MSRIGWAVTVAVVLSLGCEGKKAESTEASSPPEAAPAPSAPAAAKADAPDARAQAKEIFASRCTPCHGPTGKGDGPASAGLTPKPRNLSDPAWQSSVTDQHIEQVIAYGGAAVGKSAAMPPNPDLADKPIIPALREHIRSLKQ